MWETCLTWNLEHPVEQPKKFKWVGLYSLCKFSLMMDGRLLGWLTHRCKLCWMCCLYFDSLVICTQNWFYVRLSNMLKVPPGSLCKNRSLGKTHKPKFLSQLKSPCLLSWNCEWKIVWHSLSIQGEFLLGVKPLYILAYSDCPYWEKGRSTPLTFGLCSF